VALRTTYIKFQDCQNKDTLLVLGCFYYSEILSGPHKTFDSGHGLDITDLHGMHVLCANKLRLYF